MSITEDPFAIFKEQIEELLEENRHLDPEFQIPLEEFSLNVPKLEVLKKTLRDREENVVQQIEENRLKRQLECHFLKETSWNVHKRSPPAMICSVSGLIRVQNYPMKTVFPSPVHTRILFERIKNLLPQNSEPLKNDEKVVWKNFMNMSPHLILFPQYDLLTQDFIDKQIIFLQVIDNRIMEEFNLIFDAKRSKKLSLIKEIKHLIQQWNYLKQEVKKLALSERTTKGQTEVKRPSLRCGDLSESLLEEPFEAPEWFPEELPEKLLYVEDEELTNLESKTEEVISKDEVSSLNELPNIGEEKLFFATTKYSPPMQILANAMYGEKESPWPWIESQEKRMQKIKDEKDVKRSYANASKLQLQLQRIKPTIDNLLKELDMEIFSLSLLKIQSFQKKQTLGTMVMRLQDRIYREKILQNNLTEVKKLYSQLERESSEISANIETLFHKGDKAKLKMETVTKTLREENTTFQRHFINLPVDQYQYLLALYRDEEMKTSEDPAAQMNMTTPRIHREKKISAESNDEARKTAIGNRTWKQYLKYKKKKMDIEKELEEATSIFTQLSENLAYEHNSMAELHSRTEETTLRMAALEEQLTTLSEDVELFLLIPGRKLKINIEEMIENLSPNFTVGKLITSSELEEFEKKAGCKIDAKESQALQMLQSAVNRVVRLQEMVPGCELDEAPPLLDHDENTKNKSEVIELLKERDRLLLQVELADERLKQIMQLKLGRQLKATTHPQQADHEDKGGKQGTPEIYDSVIKLQKIQEKELKTVRQRIETQTKKVSLSKSRIKSLQKEIDELSEEIESLQPQQMLRAEKEAFTREKRLQQIMSVQRYSNALRTKEKNMIDLEKALEELSVRTYPMLPEKKLTK